MTVHVESRVVEIDGRSLRVDHGALDDRFAVIDPATETEVGWFVLRPTRVDKATIAVSAYGISAEAQSLGIDILAIAVRWASAYGGA